jgi:hypothetical protein
MRVSCLVNARGLLPIGPQSEYSFIRFALFRGFLKGIGTYGQKGCFRGFSPDMVVPYLAIPRGFGPFPPYMGVPSHPWREHSFRVRFFLAATANSAAERPRQ